MSKLNNKSLQKVLNYPVDARRDEEIHMEKVYSSLTEARTKSQNQRIRTTQRIQHGAYEDQDAFFEYSELASLNRNHSYLEQQIKSLYDTPYFAHLQITHPDEEDEEHYYLSDSPDLDSVWDIDDNHFILPFKQSNEVPIYNALFHAYQARSDEIIPIHTSSFSYDIQARLIRDVEIYRRTLKEVHTLFPRNIYPDERTDNIPKDNQNQRKDIQNTVDLYTDELLAQRLQENRGSNAFKSIIATLQEQQFDIVRTDVGISFAVQGCAGSGKSQCLIHRLFFLRDMLNKDWERVLLITPSQLFRNYSAPLMKRYHLTDIQNISLPSLYLKLLEEYDPRFKNRQYRIELSEEYLPSDYLRQVYADEYIQHIEQEIMKAISNHITDARSLLNIPITDSHYTIDEVHSLIDQIQTAITNFDIVESSLSENHDFLDKRNQILELEKEIGKKSKRRETIESNLSATKAKGIEYDLLFDEVQDTIKELHEWDLECDAARSERGQTLEEAVRVINKRHSWPESISISKHYSDALHQYLELVNRHSARSRDDAAFRQLLEDQKNMASQSLNQFCVKLSPPQWLERNVRKIAQLTSQLEDINQLIRSDEEKRTEVNQWIQDHGYLIQQREDHRAALEKSLYYLSRIESNVFEQEVWKATSALKEACGIQTVETELSPDGKHRQTRILYKSDLLFYLRIYMSLYPNKRESTYRLICIDEGQDLHKADFVALKGLFPQASINVFGDTSQALHSECGIANWKQDAFVDTVYELNTNYRNVPAIVDFVNRHFNSSMRSIGEINPVDFPSVFHSESELSKSLSHEHPLIVRDIEAFNHFCREAQMDKEQFEYYDTHAERIKSIKIPCYSVFAAKGLEFSSCSVYGYNMTNEQQLVACTRAMSRLYYCSGYTKGV